jgi:hypothetical protein
LADQTGKTIDSSAAAKTEQNEYHAELREIPAQRDLSQGNYHCITISIL